MNWEKLKDKVYFEDGSLRDILIFDWAIEDWRKWTDLVSNNYKLEFYNGQTKITSTEIDLLALKKYWKGKSDLVNQATIYLDQVIVKCYFFDDEEFENDIQPKEFRSIEDHYKLIKYLADISHLSGKTVLLTEENAKKCSAT